MIDLIKETSAAKKAKKLDKECYFVFSVKREIAKKIFAVRIGYQPCLIETELIVFVKIFKNVRKNNCICKAVRNIILTAEGMGDSVAVAYIRFGKGSSCKEGGL